MLPVTLQSPFGVQREAYGEGQMDGSTDGWTVHQKGPLIFFIFNYINKQIVLIPNMMLKNAYGFYIRSYEHFKFQN